MGLFVFLFDLLTQLVGKEGIVYLDVVVAQDGPLGHRADNLGLTAQTYGKVAMLRAVLGPRQASEDGVTALAVEATSATKDWVVPVGSPRRTTEAALMPSSRPIR